MMQTREQTRMSMEAEEKASKSRDDDNERPNGNGRDAKRLKSSEMDADENVAVAADEKMQTDPVKPKLKMNIKSWSTLAYWKWLANDDKCGICRTAFDGCCADCKIPGDDCPLVWGVCSHCFHMHCIMKWLASQQTTSHTQQCPMCRQDWILKTE